MCHEAQKVGHAAVTTDKEVTWIERAVLGHRVLRGPQGRALGVLGVDQLRQQSRHEVRLIHLYFLLLRRRSD